MFRFIRTATICNAAHTPAAVGFARELTGYLNKKYDLQLQVGVEMFDQLRMHWHFEVDKIEDVARLNQQLMEDKNYWKMLDGAKQYWVDGTLKDTIVNIMD